MRDKEILKDIDRYLKGKMTAKEADRLWGELLEHPEYMRLLETEAFARNYFQNKNSHSGQSINGANHKSYEQPAPVYKNWIYAVAALLAVILMYQLFITGPASELHAELLEIIPPQEMATMDVFRATKEETEILDLTINRGYEAAVSGRTDESFTHFSTVLESEPYPAQKAVANLNLGILHFNNSDFQSASEAFEKASENEEIADYLYEKSLWFLAHSLAREGKYDKSLEVFTTVYEHDGYFGERAEYILSKFNQLSDNL
jgi:tetratricopeptide (TPR) repeat protein